MEFAHLFALPGDLQGWQLVVAVLAGVVTTIVGLRTFFWRRLQLKTWRQNEQFQSDSHILKLCEALSSPSPRLQLAVAALLFERLASASRRQSADRERSAIVQALLAATIDHASDERAPAASPELCKYIGDSVVEVLEAKYRPNRAESPLKPYYWQRAGLTGVYWAEIDARGVDLFAANLDQASLRRARLQNVILNEASLVNAVLCGADLSGADLRKADLRGADFSDDVKDGKLRAKTNIDGARFDGARIDARTKLPAGVDARVLSSELAAV